MNSGNLGKITHATFFMIIFSRNKIEKFSKYIAEISTMYQGNIKHKEITREIIP